MVLPDGYKAPFDSIGHTPEAQRDHIKEYNMAQMLTWHRCCP